MKDKKSESFADLLEISTFDMRLTARLLRKVILEIHPAVIEEIRLSDRTAVYGIGPGMETAFCYIFPCTNWVHLGFYRGVALPDPFGLLVGTGKELRYVKIRSLAEAESDPVRALLRAAAASSPH